MSRQKGQAQAPCSVPLTMHLLTRQEATCSRNAKKLQGPDAVPDASLLGRSSNTDAIDYTKVQRGKTTRKVSEQNVHCEP